MLTRCLRSSAWFWLAAAGLFFAAPAVQAAGVEGSYHAEGENPDGGEYEADVTITQQGDVYVVEWSTDGEVFSAGVGILKNDTLSVGFAFESGAFGVVVYEVQDDGSLEGEWVLTGTEDLMPETLTPTRRSRRPRPPAEE